MTGHRFVVRLLGLLARIVPRDDRQSWLREWDGEIAFHLPKHADRSSRRWLAARLLAALQHAAWLRWASLSAPGRVGGRSGAWSDLSGDIKYALRGWRRSPGFSLTVVLTLALGLGLSTAIFSFADGYLFRPLPFPGGDRTYYVSDPNAQIASALRASDVVALRQSSVAGYGFVEWSTAHFGRELVVGDRRVETSAYEVSPGFRRTLALPLLAGRDFTVEDHASGAPRVAWLSYRFWRRELGGDREVVGRVYRVEDARDSEALRVVGILGPEVASFDLNNRPPDLVIPAQGPQVTGANLLAFPLVLLPEDVSVEQASQRIAAVLQAAAPAADGRQRSVRLTSLERAQLAGGRPTARVFFAGALLVLILAGMNLVHLLLSRGVARATEVATRAALGASRWRIVRGFLVESLLLSACGIGVGLLVAKGLSMAIASRVPQLPTAGRNLSMVPMVFDARVVAFAVTLGLIMAVAGGLWPAWRALRRTLVAPARTAGGVGFTISHRLARLILASELTVATMVVVGSVFVGLGIYRYLNQPLGFDYTDRVQVFVTSPEGRRLAGADAAASVHAIRSVRGVAAAGLETTEIPIREVEIPSRAVDTKEMRAVGVSAGYLEAWGMVLRKGRWFDAGEFQDANSVAVINARFARAAWPDSDPIGMRLRAGGGYRTVIGIVDSRRGLLEREPSPVVYLPTPQPAGRAPVIAWTPGTDVSDIRERLAAAVQAAVPGSQVAVTPVTFDRLFARGTGEARFQMPVVAAFGLLAAALAGVGVFGLVSYLVQQRTREFGIRMALGARQMDVWRAVVRESIQPTIVGLVIGSLGAWALESVVKSSVFGWQSSGLVSVMLVAAGLLVVAVIAALVPAARAARIDPAVTLRAE